MPNLSRPEESWRLYQGEAMNITLNLDAPVVGTPPFEFPKHSFKAFWTEDGRIGVIAIVQRTDGGIHMMQDIIDVPPKEKK
jgi:hypothetical protein